MTCRRGKHLCDRASHAPSNPFTAVTDTSSRHHSPLGTSALLRVARGPCCGERTMHVTMTRLRTGLAVPVTTGRLRLQDQPRGSFGSMRPLRRKRRASCSSSSLADNEGQAVPPRGYRVGPPTPPAAAFEESCLPHILLNKHTVLSGCLRVTVLVGSGAASPQFHHFLDYRRGY